MAFYEERSENLHILELPAKIVDNLEILDIGEYNKLIKAFIQEKKIAASEVIAIFSQKTCFKLEAEVGSHDNKKIEEKVKNFVESVPFERVYVKEAVLEKKKVVVAINRGLYEPLMNILIELGFKLQLMTSAYFVSKMVEKPGFNQEIAKFIIQEENNLEQFNFIKEEKVKAKMELAPKKDDKKTRNKIIMLATVFILLVVVMILVVLRNRNEMKKLEESNRIEAQKMKDQDLQLEEEAKQEALDKANSLTQDSGQEEATDSTALNSDNQVSIDSEELQKLEIVIQNGSGVPGDANNLKKVLEQAGFDNITTNNAESQRTGKTQVLYQSGLNPLIIEFLAENVKSFVGDIVLLENKSIDSDILITTSKR